MFGMSIKLLSFSTLKDSFVVEMIVFDTIIDIGNFGNVKCVGLYIEKVLFKLAPSTSKELP